MGVVIQDAAKHCWCNKQAMMTMNDASCYLTNSVMASLAKSVPLDWACLAALAAASFTGAGAGCQSGGPCIHMTITMAKIIVQVLASVLF